MITFDQTCEKCPRISTYLEHIRRRYPEYHARPVPSFGEKNPILLIVGLAPGLHGANATGRPFTGDYAGILLYETLHQYGFSNQAEASSKKDGLKLLNCHITNAVKCVPPDNKPTAEEINTCNDYLKEEISRFKSKLIILALGHIAHKAVLKALALKQKDFQFGHNKCHELSDGRWLLDSYHCSRYNTNTGRLTKEMFHDVFKKILEIKDIIN